MDLFLRGSDRFCRELRIAVDARCLRDWRRWGWGHRRCSWWTLGLRSRSRVGIPEIAETVEVALDLKPRALKQ
jgi:hypothetical protein